MKLSIRDIAAACTGVVLVGLVGQLTAFPARDGQAGRGGGSNFREPDPIDFADHTGFASIFDGATLGGWDGDRSVWRVEDGAISGVVRRYRDDHGAVALDAERGTQRVE